MSMGSHTSDFGEPRTVAGYEVSFTVTTFTNSVARSLDVYAKDVNGEDVLLTDESIDDIPNDDDIIDLLDAAIGEDKLAGPHKVSYEIRSLNGGGKVVAEGTCIVKARTTAEAEAAATAWVHDNDPHDDPRLDPVVEIVDVDTCPVSEVQ